MFCTVFVVLFSFVEVYSLYLTLAVLIFSRLLVVPPCFLMIFLFAAVDFGLDHHLDSIKMLRFISYMFHGLNEIYKLFPDHRNDLIPPCPWYKTWFGLESPEQPTGMWGFPPVCGRYHMPTDLKNDTYVPLACVTSGRAGKNDMRFSWVFVEFSFMGGLADAPTTSKWYMCNYVKQYSVHLFGHPFAVMAVQPSQ